MSTNEHQGYLSRKCSKAMFMLFGSYGSNVNGNKSSSNGMAGGNVHSFNSIPFVLPLL